MRTRKAQLGHGLLVAVGVTLFLAPGWSQEGKPAPMFVGVDRCGRCHGSKATGQQVQSWRTSAHAKAWETLGTDRAREVAAKFGIAEPQDSQSCLRCHTTGAGEAKERLAEGFKRQDGVQCESCHGAGADYGKIEHMIDDAKARAAGLIDPGPPVCKRCHNADSPTFTGFDYKTALERIRHRLVAY